MRMIEMFFGDMSTVLKPSDSYAMVQRLKEERTENWR